MIAAIIRGSVIHRVPVLMAAVLLAAWGLWSLSRTPLDALPDLSDTQVILRTEWPGQPPQLVEDQVTYPLASTMLSVPGVRAVRGFSFFGDSFVYVLFDDATDLYWARARVLEYLSQARDRLPDDVSPSLGPDATGLGWIYQYAIVDRNGTHDLGQLRSLQDWFLRYELLTVPDVSEVATVGGMVRAWQIVPNTTAMSAHGVTVEQIVQAFFVQPFAKDLVQSQRNIGVFARVIRNLLDRDFAHQDLLLAGPDQLSDFNRFVLKIAAGEFV